MSFTCRRSALRRAARPSRPVRVAVHDPIDAVTALLLGFDGHAPDGDLLLLVERDGFASVVIAPSEMRLPSAAPDAALDAALDLVIDAIDDWNIGGVVGAMTRRDEQMDLSPEEVARWTNAAARLARAGTPLLDVLVLTPADWASLRWRDGESPLYRFD